MCRKNKAHSEQTRLRRFWSRSKQNCNNSILPQALEGASTPNLSVVSSRPGTLIFGKPLVEILTVSAYTGSVYSTSSSSMISHDSEDLDEDVSRATQEVVEQWLAARRLKCPSP